MSDDEKITEVLLNKISGTGTGYVRQAQLIPDVLPFSAATLWRLVKAGEFPAPVKLSKRVTAWRISDIKKWLNDLHAQNKPA
jgi:predicted DNA-binding transcriptional regulator AlpA